MNLPPMLYTLEQAARQLGYHTRTLYRMIDNKEIRAVRIRHRWMIPHDALTKYIDDQPTNNA
ncbi:MAG: Helix-turn-helix domain [Prosthecobacter sp.]|nr:Helix-turn-helix domain [Prosthecobacter sp.]